MSWEATDDGPSALVPAAYAGDLGEIPGLDQAWLLCAFGKLIDR